MNSDFLTEIIKKLPWSGTFLIAGYFFFKDKQELVGWICIVVAIIVLFLVIRFEYYEKIIDRQEKQIKQYSKQAIDSQIGATKAISEMNTSVSSQFDSFNKDSDNQTKTT